jgi:tetratricopeptide (TPR) repeat protein
VLLLQGKVDEARAASAGLEADDYRRLVGEAILAARTGDRQLALDKLRAMQGRYGDAALFQYAEIYAQLGMVDQALAELEKAYQARDPGLSYIRVNPFLDPIRNQPRFKAVEARLNFPA